MSTTIDVRCEDVTDDGWRCTVVVDDGRSAPTTHEVTVWTTYLEQLAPGAQQPTDLVRRSFEFLLGREPKTSILDRFDLPLIGRYFPEYERRIRR